MHSNGKDPTVSEGIALMNTIIAGTKFKEDLRRFQEERKLGDKMFQRGIVTEGWWSGFKRWYRHRLVTRRGERFACNCADWTKLPNIVQMYNIIYGKLVDAGVAIKLDSPSVYVRVWSGCVLRSHFFKRCG